MGAAGPLLPLTPGPGTRDTWGTLVLGIVASYEEFRRFVITRQNASAAHALAHIGFPGATGAILVGAPVTLGLAVFCVGGGLLSGLFGHATALRITARPVRGSRPSPWRSHSARYGAASCWPRWSTCRRASSSRHWQ